MALLLVALGAPLFRLVVDTSPKQPKKAGSKGFGFTRRVGGSLVSVISSLFPRSPPVCAGYPLPRERRPLLVGFIQYPHMYSRRVSRGLYLASLRGSSPHAAALGYSPLY